MIAAGPLVPFTVIFYGVGRRDRLRGVTVATRAAWVGSWRLYFWPLDPGVCELMRGGGAREQSVCLWVTALDLELRYSLCFLLSAIVLIVC